MQTAKTTQLREPQAAGGPLPIRIDLHVHTQRYSPCAPSLTLDQIVAVLDRGEIDGVVLADHDVLWPAVEIEALNATLQRGRIYRGMEASSVNGHFVLIGLKNTNSFHPGDTLEALQIEAHTQGAAVIWAHPHQTYRKITQPLYEARLPAGIDAVEVASTVTTDTAAEAARQLAIRHGLSMVAGSDAHCAAAVGQVVTRFAQLPCDEGALARMIRLGQCAPWIVDPPLMPCP